MNRQKVLLLTKCIVNKTFGYDIPITIKDEWGQSSAEYIGSRVTNQVKIKQFTFGAYIMTVSDDECFKYICHKYPIVDTVEPMLFAILHEIGHLFYPKRCEVSDDFFDKMFSSMAQYREFPDEKFADEWAANFIKKNQSTVALWNKHLKKALDD